MLDFYVNRIHLKHQVLFSLKNNEKKIGMNVVCCSRDWRFKVNIDMCNKKLNDLI